MCRTFLQPKSPASFARYENHGFARFGRRVQERYRRKSLRVVTDSGIRCIFSKKFLRARPKRGLPFANHADFPQRGTKRQCYDRKLRIKACSKFSQQSVSARPFSNVQQRPRAFAGKNLREGTDKEPGASAQEPIQGTRIVARMCGAPNQNLIELFARLLGL